MSQIEAIIDDLLNEEQDIFGVAIINKDGNLITQTENWNITSDLDLINELLNQKLELGEKGLQLAKKITWEKATTDTLSAYYAILEHKSGTPTG